MGLGCTGVVLDVERELVWGCSLLGLGLEGI